MEAYLLLPYRVLANCQYCALSIGQLVTRWTALALVLCELVFRSLPSRW